MKGEHDNTVLPAHQSPTPPYSSSIYLLKDSYSFFCMKAPTGQGLQLECQVEINYSRTWRGNKETEIWHLLYLQCIISCSDWLLLGEDERYVMLPIPNLPPHNGQCVSSTHSMVSHCTGKCFPSSLVMPWCNFNSTVVPLKLIWQIVSFFRNIQNWDVSLNHFRILSRRAHMV